MTDPAQIARLAEGLTARQRNAVRRGQSEHVSMPAEMWNVLTRLCKPSTRRPALFEEGQIGALVTFRLTPVGLAVRAHLTTAAQEKKDG